MKTPDTTKAVSSAPSKRELAAPCGLPATLNTVIAEVLARLLNHKRLTSLDAVDEASTTSLSAVTHYLVKEYGGPSRPATRLLGAAMESEFAAIIANTSCSRRVRHEL